MLEADRDLFARPLVVAQTREMDLREVFKYFLWLAKCSINLYLCSTKYIFIQQFTVIFNILYLCSTMRILFSYSTKLFSFNNNNYLTSIAIFILLNKINCSTSVQTFHSTKIIIQLLPYRKFSSICEPRYDKFHCPEHRSIFSRHSHLGSFFFVFFSHGKKEACRCNKSSVAL